MFLKSGNDVKDRYKSNSLNRLCAQVNAKKKYELIKYLDYLNFYFDQKSVKRFVV